MIEVREKEIWRYLGYRGSEPDEDTKEQIRENVRILQQECMPGYIVREYPLAFADTGCGNEELQNTSAKTGDTPGICFGGLRTDSHSLCRHLAGCEKVLLFAATLGHAPDRLIRRFSVGQVSRAVICQAVAAEMIEAYCDDLNEKLEEKYQAEGWTLRRRFSPGYGDLPLELQKDIVRLLNTPKEIGLTLTESLIMLPTKSVTAIIGMERGATAAKTAESRDDKDKCALCSSAECPYRR